MATWGLYQTWGGGIGEAGTHFTHIREFKAPNRKAAEKAARAFARRTGMKYSIMTLRKRKYSV